MAKAYSKLDKKQVVHCEKFKKLTLVFWEIWVLSKKCEPQKYLWYYIMNLKNINYLLITNIYISWNL